MALQPCFAPKYEIIGEFEKFYFLSLEVLVFSISKTSKGAFFSESDIRFSNLQKNIPNNYHELEI